MAGEGNGDEAALVRVAPDTLPEALTVRSSHCIPLYNVENKIYIASTWWTRSFLSYFPSVN